MVLTAARPSEALEARWAEVDFDRRLWTLPPREDVERQTTRRAALFRRARGARSPSESRTGDAVFPGRSGAPLSYASFASAPAKAGIDACTPHGWRSCFRDWCNDIGDVPRDLAEAALAHGLNATEGAYRRMTAVERRVDEAGGEPDWLRRSEVSHFPPLDVFYRALKASEGVAGLSAVMRGLIAARIRRMTRASAACRPLMTIPGVGQLTAFAFVAAIDDPSLTVS